MEEAEGAKKRKRSEAAGMIIHHSDQGSHRKEDGQAMKNTYDEKDISGWFFLWCIQKYGTGDKHHDPSNKIQLSQE